MAIIAINSASEASAAASWIRVAWLTTGHKRNGGHDGGRRE
jgi:hypothetical protein